MLKQKAAYIDNNKPVYDVLLDDYEPGMTMAELSPLFDRLKNEIRDLVLQTKAKKTSFVSLTTHAYDVDKQWDVGIDILKQMGF
jgi:carboxypeptidase Taq